MKAYIVSDDKEIINFLPELEITDSLKEAKIVIFGNGPIVSPSLYKEKKISELDLKCDINRDRSDKAIYTKLCSDQIAIGIGRGACFLAVMNGASLIQYTYKKNKNRSYDVQFAFQDKIYAFPVISDWVQSINLEKCTDFKLHGRSREAIDYIASNDTKRFMRYNGDPEVVTFHKPKNPLCICVQFHPEWMPEAYSTKLIRELIYEYANS